MELEPLESRKNGLKPYDSFIFSMLKSDYITDIEKDEKKYLGPYSQNILILVIS